jgi:hypothetical protein
MGLDMYLTSNKRGEVLYWRKANHIHGWFERKLNGVRNQRNHPIKADDLEDLLGICIRVKDSLIAGGMRLKDTVVESGYKDGEHYEKVEPRPHYVNTTKALELLPPTPGFFFGSYDIDEWYLKDIEDTIEGIAAALSTKEKGERFYYHAWW